MTEHGLLAVGRDMSTRPAAHGAASLDEQHLHGALHARRPDQGNVTLNFVANLALSKCLVGELFNGIHGQREGCSARCTDRAGQPPWQKQAVGRSDARAAQCAWHVKRLGAASALPPAEWPIRCGGSAAIDPWPFGANIGASSGRRPATTGVSTAALAAMDEMARCRWPVFRAWAPVSCCIWPMHSDPRRWPLVPLVDRA